MNARSATTLFGLLSLGAFGTASGQTVAGTEISNIATASYTNAAGQSLETASNEVTTDVLPIYRFEILPNGSDTADAGGTTPNALEGVAGGEVYFTYFLENLGNTDGQNGFADGNAVTLGVQNSTSDDDDFVGQTIVVDLNDSGVPDEGDVVLSPGDSYTFPYGSLTRLFVVADVPAQAQNGDRVRTNLTGNADNAPDTAPLTVDEDNWAEVAVSRNAELTFDKTAPGNVVPNGTVAYELMGGNPAGNLNPYALADVVSVTNGDSATLLDGVLVSDVLPDGLTLPSAASVTTTATDVTLLYSADGGTTWTTAFSTGANAVALLFGTGDNTDGRIDTDGAVFDFELSFSATVPADALATTRYTNDAELRYDSGGDGLAQDGGTPDEVLNDAETTTVDPSGTFAVGPDGYPEAGATGSYEVGDEGFAISRSGDRQTVASVPEGSEVSFLQSLGNSRNYPDTFALTSTLSSLPAGSVTFYEVNADGSRGPLITAPLAVAANSTKAFFFVVSLPANFDLYSAPLDFEITATSTETPDVGDTTINTISVVTEAQAVNLGNNPNGTPSELPTNFPVLPNETAFIPLSVTNNGVYADTFDLVLGGTLPNGFTTTIYSDVNCNGVLDAGTDLPLAAAETAELEPGAEGCFIVAVAVPGGSAPASYDLSATATSQTDGTIRDAITNTVTVGLAEDLTFVADGAQTTSPTVSVIYTHTLTNNANQEALVALSRTGGTAGWTYEYSLVDPASGSSIRAAAAEAGLADFADTLPPFTVGANGATRDIWVRVTPDPDADYTAGYADTITLTATATYGGVAATEPALFVTDVTTVDANFFGELELVKAVDRATAEPGDTLTYTITGTNVGNGDITNVQIGDYIPANTGYLAGSLGVTATGFTGTALYSADGATWTDNAGTLTISDGTAAANGSTFYVGVDTNGDDTIGGDDIIPAGGVVTVTFSVTVD